jgi:hypothetical protein
MVQKFIKARFLDVHSALVEAGAVTFTSPLYEEWRIQVRSAGMQLSDIVMAALLALEPQVIVTQEQHGKTARRRVATKKKPTVIAVAGRIEKLPVHGRG